MSILKVTDENRDRYKIAGLVLLLILVVAACLLLANVALPAMKDTTTQENSEAAAIEDEHENTNESGSNTATQIRWFSEDYSHELVMLDEWIIEVPMVEGGQPGVAQTYLIIDDEDTTAVSAYINGIEHTVTFADLYEGDVLVGQSVSSSGFLSSQEYRYHLQQ